MSPLINKISVEIAAINERMDSIATGQLARADVNAVVARILELHRNDLRGPEGVAGPVGPQGIAGSVGDQGPVGPIGQRWQTGVQGTAGIAPTLGDVMAALKSENIAPGGQRGGAGGNVDPGPVGLVKAGTCFDPGINSPVIGVKFEFGALLCDGQNALFTLMKGSSSFIYVNPLGAVDVQDSQTW